MNDSVSKAPLNVVDLFCGGGGLACGFDLHRGALRYRTVLGIDVEPAAIRIFNSNFRSPAGGAGFRIGRLADMTWFTHPTEIRLFYLVHLAYSHSDDELKQALRRAGLDDFLGLLRRADKTFAEAAERIGLSPQ